MYDVLAREQKPFWEMFTFDLLKNVVPSLVSLRFLSTLSVKHL